MLPATPGDPGGRIVGPLDLLANAKDFLQRQTRDWAKRVTPAEAVRRYQSYGTGYTLINGFLRTGKAVTGFDPDRLTATIADLDTAIARGGVPFGLPVAGAVLGSDKLLDAWRAVEGIGIPWVEPGFLSTSLTERRAPGCHGPTPRPVVFAFTLPALTPFAYPAAVTSQGSHQFELLLGPGTRFAIRSVRQGGKITRVEAELLRV